MDVATRSITVALIGNPNTGKTTLFNELSGLRHRVGNYPGVTVETVKGQTSFQDRTIDLVDLPGTYSLAPRSPDEMLAVDLLLGLGTEPPPDVLLAVADAGNLERNLFLVTQLMELGKPVVIALTMGDVAARMGVEIDTKRLAQELNVVIVPVHAARKQGLAELREALVRAVERPFVPVHVPVPDAFARETKLLAEEWHQPEFLTGRMLLDMGGYALERLAAERGDEVRGRIESTRQRLKEQGLDLRSLEAKVRYTWIRDVLSRSVRYPQERRVAWTDRFDRILTHRLWGSLVFLGVMFLVFQSIFTWAKPLMQWIGLGKDFLAEGARSLIPPGPLAGLVADGIVEGVGSVLIFLPQIALLFLFLALLEDCGYMARAAYLMDRIMARCGLNGKSFLPLLSSMACAVPGILSARVIDQPRDRLATILVAPLMSCSARLPVYILFIGVFLTAGYPWWVPGLTMFGMFALGLVVAPLVALLLKRTLLRGDTPPFVMEMPLYQWPSWRTVLRRVYDACWEFVSRAGTLILASMVIIWALLYFPANDAAGRSYHTLIAEQEKIAADDPDQAEVAEARIGELQAMWKRGSYLGQLGRSIEPVLRPLGWDWKIGVAVLASFTAREVFVGTLALVYQQGKPDIDELRSAPFAEVADSRLGRALREAKWEGEDRVVITLPVALSVLVFFALCCQCVSTLAVIKRETKSWRWPIFTFTYMTVLAYVAALAVNQIGCRIGH